MVLLQKGPVTLMQEWQTMAWRVEGGGRIGAANELEPVPDEQLPMHSNMRLRHLQHFLRKGGVYSGLPQSPSK